MAQSAQTEDVMLYQCTKCEGYFESLIYISTHFVHSDTTYYNEICLCIYCYSVFIMNFGIMIGEIFYSPN